MFVFLDIYVGLRDRDDENIEYSATEVAQLWKSSSATTALGRFEMTGVGSEPGAKPETSVKIEQRWQVSEVDLSKHCALLNEFFATIFDELHQRSILLCYQTDLPTTGMIELHYKTSRFLDADNLRWSTHFADAVATSPFTLDHLVKRCNDELFICGQGLYHLIKKEHRSHYKEMLFNFLSLGRSRSVRILVCDASKDFAVETWVALTGPDYRRQLSETMGVLSDWQAEANKNGATGFVARKTTIFPITLTFVDPRNVDRGMLVLIPAIAALSNLRPAVVMFRREHKNVFNYYWTICDELFDDSRRTRPIDAP